MRKVSKSFFTEIKAIKDSFYFVFCLLQSYASQFWQLPVFYQINCFNDFMKDLPGPNTKLCAMKTNNFGSDSIRQREFYF